MNPFKGNAIDWQVRLRLIAAIIMAVYVTTHTINIALGLASVSAMDAVQVYLTGFWRSGPLYWLVITAIAVHVSLGLWKLFKRNTLTMPPWEAMQIVMGTAIPFFLLSHISYTRGMHLLFGVRDTYTYELLRTFPGNAWIYILMTAIVWGHAQIGVHYIMRVRTWYARVRPVIIALFLLLPALGIAGYITAGMEVSALAEDGTWLEAQKSEISWPTDGQLAAVRTASLSYCALLPIVYMVVLGSRALRVRVNRKGRMVVVRHSDGRSVTVTPTATILEASRIGGIPHASICGGRGRCSTCRVRIDKGLDGLKPAGERESHVLRLIEAEANVRLACQTECAGDITVTRLLPPDITAAVARKTGKYSTGKDMKLVVMFADLRQFTRLSEGKLPYDLVFMLNRYFTYMGEAIEEHGGFIDKFIGDGIMALFGLETDIRTACRQSISAAKKMAARLDEINDQLSHDLKEPLRIGIGLHVGDVILGEMGYKLATKLTAIGDAVNTASRLEVLNKQANSQLIFSRELAEWGGLDTTGLSTSRILIRGKEKPMEVFIIKEIGKLPEAIAAGASKGGQA